MKPNTIFPVLISTLLLAVVGVQGATFYRETRAVPVVEMGVQCYGTNTEFLCTFTNSESFDAKGCALGRLSQKEGNLSVKSQVICTGTLESMDSRHVQGMWVSGTPIEICNTRNEILGTEQLDWDKCTFEIESANVSAP